MTNKWLIATKDEENEKNNNAAFVIHSTRSIRNNVKMLLNFKSAFSIFHYELTGKS